MKSTINFVEIQFENGQKASVGIITCDHPKIGSHCLEYLVASMRLTPIVHTVEPQERKASVDPNVIQSFWNENMRPNLIDLIQMIEIDKPIITQPPPAHYHAQAISKKPISTAHASHKKYYRRIMK